MSIFLYFLYLPPPLCRRRFPASHFFGRRLSAVGCQVRFWRLAAALYSRAALDILFSVSCGYRTGRTSDTIFLSLYGKMSGIRIRSCLGIVCVLCKQASYCLHRLSLCLPPRRSCVLNAESRPRLCYVPDTAVRSLYILARRRSPLFPAMRLSA